MNKKHMNAQLCKVFDNFVNSIEDEEIKKLINTGTIITGGALVSLLNNEQPNDYDIYFKDFNTCYKVAEYFVNKWNALRKDVKRAEIKIKNDDKEKPYNWIYLEEAKEQVAKGLEPRIRVFIRSAGVAGENAEEYSTPFNTEVDDEMQTNVEPESNIEKELEEEPKYVPKFLTSNAISLSGKVQLIIRFYGKPEEIHANYDFVHCTNYWTSWDREVTLKQAALEAIINKELLYIGSKYPLCSIIRTRKFINRGWTINAGQYLKMCMQLNDLNLKDIYVLEDQLVGVDTAYFGMLIDALQKKKEEDPTFEINNLYVSKIIDKLF